MSRYLSDLARRADMALAPRDLAALVALVVFAIGTILAVDALGQAIVAARVTP